MWQWHLTYWISPTCTFMSLSGLYPPVSVRPMSPWEGANLPLDLEQLEVLLLTVGSLHYA